MLNDDLDILARTIFGEARGDYKNFGLASFIAIADVIINRKSKNFQKTITEVCLAPYQFSCWNENDPNYVVISKPIIDSLIFKKCVYVAQNVFEGKWPDLTDGCDHYHLKGIKPYWAARLTPKRMIGSHCFYELTK